MSYQSFPWTSLGKGLNLRDKPDAVDQAECIDAMNVAFTERGAVVSRGGYQKRATVSCRGIASFEQSTGLTRILTCVGTAAKAYSTTGAEQASYTISDTSKSMSVARYGTPSAEYAFLGNGTDSMLRFDGSSFTVRAALPKAAALAVMPADNRLVAGAYTAGGNGPAGATVSPSHVHFSDPGDPDTWGVNNYVQLTPGDGDRTTGIAAWRELIFVFKREKFFVFYGNSVESGGPVFNYRPVEGGVGLVAPQGLAALSDGLYFVAEDGLYRTDGSNPERVSDLVSPLWDGGTSPFYTGGTILDVTQCSLAAVDGKLYMAFPTSNGPRVLVYDPDGKWFSLWDLPATSVHGLNGSLWFSGANLCQHRPSDTDDAGSPIEARWRSGWVDFSSPDMKVDRARKAWGVGRLNMSVSTDFENDPGNESPLDFTTTAQPQWNAANGEQWDASWWAGARSLTAKQHRRAVRGTTFSTLLRGDGPWALHRLDHLIRQVRQPGIEDTP